MATLKRSTKEKDGNKIKELEGSMSKSKNHILISKAVDKNGEPRYDEERLQQAAQDQGLMTNGFKKMCGLQENYKYRFFQEATESTNHLISGCQILLADGHYTKVKIKSCDISTTTSVKKTVFQLEKYGPTILTL